MIRRVAAVWPPSGVTLTHPSTSSMRTPPLSQRSFALARVAPAVALSALVIARADYATTVLADSEVGR